MTKKYELLSTQNSKLFRIRALKSFADVKEGAVGGFVESENNLSQEKSCWIYDNARVTGNASVRGCATIRNKAKVYGKACVYGDTLVGDKAQVYGSSLVSGSACVKDNAWVYGKSKVRDRATVGGDAKIRGNALVTGISYVADTTVMQGFDTRGVEYVNKETTGVVAEDAKILFTSLWKGLTSD